MAIPAMRIHAFIFIFSWITMCTEKHAIALKQTKISNLLSIFMALIFPYQLTADTEAIWSGRTLVRVSWSNILSALLSVGCLVHIYRKHFKDINSDGVDGADAVSDGTLWEEGLRTHSMQSSPRQSFPLRALQPRRACGPRIHLSSSIARALPAPRNNPTPQNMARRSSDSKIFSP